MPGFNGNVNAFAIYDGRLVVGGNFTIAVEILANNIAIWDGTTWDSLGSGINDTVYSVGTYDGHLIAGGAFTSAGGTTVNRIAAWDGYGWSALGSGTNGNVRAIQDYDRDLVIGGEFTMAGGTAVDHYAIDLSFFDVGDESSERRAFHVAAGETAVVVSIGLTNPTLMLLALDERFGRLPLSIQAVELLVEPFICRLTGIYRTSDSPIVALAYAS